MKYLPFSLFVLLIACFPLKKAVNEAPHWNKIFSERNVNGTFVLYHVQTKEWKYHNRARSDSAFIPASTFKILNSLIALENHVVQDENEIIPWDGIDKGWDKWNRNHTMSTAMPVSCVWFYQELARRIGIKRMQKGINRAHYGNCRMGSKIDDFWLVGQLKISAKEQVLFLEKLIKNQLPFSTQYQEIVKKIMITDTTNQYVIHSKTGWGKKQKIGWIVGFVESHHGVWVFALNMEIARKSDLKWRKKILYQILKSENIIE